jgi:hypothetical protein
MIEWAFVYTLREIKFYKNALLTLKMWILKKILWFYHKCNNWKNISLLVLLIQNWNVSDWRENE